jgi:thioredoxin reductase
MSGAPPALPEARVVVVGAGPSGLAAATALRHAGVGGVTVLEREQTAGGIPCHTDHLGYGVRDLHRVLRGPAYAARLTAAAVASGADVRCGATVVEVGGDHVTLADGTRLDADAVVLATGVRERPRSARLVPGDRPGGVLTTGAVQQLTALHHRDVGTRAVIVGAEHVSFSAIWSLRHGGCRTVAMVTPLPRHQTYAPLRWLTAGLRRVPVHTSRTVVEIVGRPRVRAVRLDDGTELACDTVVFTGDWVPVHELVRRAGATMVPVSKAPATTSGCHTSITGLFAIGNLVHPAETADVCALDGRRAAVSVVAWLAERRWPQAPSPIVIDDPDGTVAWAAHTSRGVTVRATSFGAGTLELVDGDGDVVGRSRRRRLVPNRSITVGARVGADTAVVAVRRRG